MLEGSELSAAYAPMLGASPMNNDSIDINSMQDQFATNQYEAEERKPVQRKSIKLSQLNQQNMNQLPDNPVTQHIAENQAIQAKYNQKFAMPGAVQQPQQPIQSLAGFDPSMFNKQFEQEQKVAFLVNELKKQKAATAAAIQQPMYQHYEESYIDKLMNKKKEILKFVQSGLIILFAISIHFVVDFLLKHYLQTYEVSFNREVMLRVLYPVSIVFVAWNLIAWMK
jgi:hypothetical protein